MTFFSTSDFWDVPLDPNPTASSYQPPYYIVAKDIAQNDSSASFQLTSAMNRFRRDFLAAYISASSDPGDVRQDHRADHSGSGQRAEAGQSTRSAPTPRSVQDLGVIGRDNQNRIRWGNLLTLPVAQGGLLYVEPVYASPGASDAASSYPRLIRVAMMYNDKIGYGPTVRDALDRTVRAGRRRDGDRAGADRVPPVATRGAPADRRAACRRRRRPTAGQAPQAPPEVPAAVPPGGATQLSAAKAAALQEVNTALDALHQAQQSGDFAEYGEALQRLDDAVKKYQSAD